MTKSRRIHPVLALAAVATFLAAPAAGQAPAHDACPSAISIEQEDFLGFADLSTATSALDEPVNPCIGARPERTVWYRFEAPDPGRLIVDTCNTGYPIALAAFAGTCEAPGAAAACSSTACGLIDISVTAGTELRFQAGIPPGGEPAFLTFSLCFIGPDPEDTDEDLAPDCLDPCTDSDQDGFGDPGFVRNACPLDNCPDDPNPDQADRDGDGVGDACDRCDGEDESDADGDGDPDCTDPCTDVDRDGFGNPGFPHNTCAPDNCPFEANPGQADRDGDGVGDACDPCPDEPNVDSDGDLIEDCRDDCTDLDLDEFGDPGFPHNTCRTDNCPPIHNPDQGDADGDGVGDPCDPDRPEPCLPFAEAAARGLVTLTGKGCFAGDCVAIEVTNGGDADLCVEVPKGEVVLPRDPGAQALAVSRTLRIHVPKGRSVRVGGLFTFCLQLAKHGPALDTIFDVTDALRVTAARSAAAAALAALIEIIDARHAWNDPAAQSAVWSLTDGEPPGDGARALLAAAGLDPGALPDDFPDLVTPNPGGTDPLAGVVTPTPPSPDLEGPCPPTGALADVDCWLDRLEARVAGATDLRGKPRRRLGRAIASVRKHLTSVAAAEKPRARAKRSRALTRALDALARAAAGASARLSDPSRGAGMIGEAEGARRAASAVTSAT